MPQEVIDSIHILAVLNLSIAMVNSRLPTTRIFLMMPVAEIMMTPLFTLIPAMLLWTMTMTLMNLIVMLLPLLTLLILIILILLLLLR
jgi:hypothetical protein